MIGDILIIIGIFYLNIFIHEAGHCVMPRLAGIKGFNIIYMGIGKGLHSFKIGGLTIIINRFLVPFGYIRAKEKIEYNNLNTIQKTLLHLGGIIFNLIIAVIAFGVIYYSDYDFLLIGKFTSLPVYILKSVGHSALWVFLNGAKGASSLLNAKNDLGIYFYWYVFGIINSFIFIFNTIPIPMMVKNGKVLFNDGGQLIFKVLFNKGI